jgi:hypothetical protein
MPSALDVDPLSHEREVADARCRRLWKRFGFRRYREDIFYLDTSLWAVEDKVKRFLVDVRAAPAIRLP